MTDLAQLSAQRPLLGDVALLESSPYFDASWYLQCFPDAVDCGLSPAEHYLWVGAVMQRDPSPYFSGTFYLEQNPEVAAIRMNPLVHFLRHGHAEGRPARPDDITPPIPENRPAQEIVGPAPWGDDLRNSKIQTSLGKGGITDKPGSAILKLADTIIAEAKSPLISVILPVQGRGFFRALDSALDQTLQPLEILLVHGAGHTEIVTQIRRSYTEAITKGQLRLFRSEDSGLAAARNTALDAARGDLISYLDGESHWRPDYLRLMAAWFSENDDLMTGYASWTTHRVKGDQGQHSGFSYDRAALLQEQTINLNSYMHRRVVWEQLGGFDEDMGGSAGWDLILRQTALYAPGHLAFVGADVLLDPAAAVSSIERTNALAKHRIARWRYDQESPRIAYVLWDWPALSQSFVLSELAWLVSRGFDVEVFFKIAPDRAAEVPFDIKQHQVDTPEELSRLLIQRDRTLVHCHFAYPAMTLLAWPACQLAGIPYTFCAHAVDIFLHNNIPVNRIDEVMNDPLCIRAFVPGDYHRHHLEAQNIPIEKLSYVFQAADLDLMRAIPDRKPPPSNTPVRGAFIARFVDKKGIGVLIEAAMLLHDTNVAFDIYGYGPLEDTVKARAAELGVTNISFHGPLDGRYALRDALSNTDFFISPSIVAHHGDTEGFPTIVLEAMAARRPVVTTSVSVIPEYLADGVNAHIAAPDDPEALASAVRRMLGTPDVQRAAMLRNACDFLQQNVGQERTMQAYCDAWYDVVVDIVLVTYNAPDYDDRDETFEIIRRIRAHTTTPYRLVVIDNGSDASFRDDLIKLSRMMPNMRLHLLDKNRFVGPATNIALAGSDAVYAIYVCSKEGFVARHGWERPLINYMRRNPEVAMGGNFCHLPSHTLGAEMAKHPAFEHFRNPAFAKENPKRPFQHVQGGVFILRRSVIDSENGFSTALPQDSTDVEFSYYLESRGLKIRKIPEVASLTVKTLPRLDAVLDETTSIAHPISLSSVTSLDRLQTLATTRCNLCQGWDCLQNNGRCVQCQSSGMDRKLYRRIAHDWRAHRGGRALLVDCVASLVDALGSRMFEVTPTTWQDLPQSDSFSLICLGSAPNHEMAIHLLARLAPGGLMIWPEGGGAEPAALVKKTPGLTAGFDQHLSRVLRSDSRRLCWLARAF